MLYSSSKSRWRCIWFVVVCWLLRGRPPCALQTSLMVEPLAGSTQKRRFKCNDAREASTQVQSMSPTVSLVLHHGVGLWGGGLMRHCVWLSNWLKEACLTHLSDKALVVDGVIWVVARPEHMLGSLWIRDDQEAGRWTCSTHAHQLDSRSHSNGVPLNAVDDLQTLRRLRPSAC